MFKAVDALIFLVGKAFPNKNLLEKGLPMRLGSKCCLGGLFHTLKKLYLNVNICLLYIRGQRERKNGFTNNAMSRKVDEMMMRDMRQGTCRFLWLAEKATLHPKKCSPIASAIGGQRCDTWWKISESHGSSCWFLIFRLSRKKCCPFTNARWKCTLSSLGLLCSFVLKQRSCWSLGFTTFATEWEGLLDKVCVKLCL